ncbi:hypothetical protein ACLOJK_010429 [Asimina triloba]
MLISLPRGISMKFEWINGATDVSFSDKQSPSWSFNTSSASIIPKASKARPGHSSASIVPKATVGAWVVVVTAPTASAETLKVGVPAHSPYPKYVTVKCNDTRNETCFSGHSINVFRLVWKNLNNNIDYEFIPYDGPYDSLIETVFYKRFDAVVGDTSVVAKRCDYVEFSRPYTKMGARMVVLERPARGRAWIFVKPFTASLWGVTGVIFLYNGLIVWLIETADSEEKRSFFVNSFNLIWLAATALFPINGEKVNSNLSKMALVVWLFVALVLTQSYTASLTSMLTVRRLRPSVVDVESLLNGKAKVGCDKGSFMSRYLEDVVGFNAACVETFNLDEYASALSNGTIKAAFLEFPSIQLFLDQNPKGFTVAGRTYEIGGYAFLLIQVFPKGSRFVEEVSDEILRLRENGTLRMLEESLLSSRKTSTSTTALDGTDADQQSLTLDEFLGLYLITCSMSTLAILLFFLGRATKKWREGRKKNSSQVQTMGPTMGLFSRRPKNRIHDMDEPDPAQHPPHEIEIGELGR